MLYLGIYQSDSKNRYQFDIGQNFRIKNIKKKTKKKKQPQLQQHLC